MTVVPVAALSGPGSRGGLGAPGILLTSPDPLRSLAGVRRDVAAFVGVAPRGPVRVPAVALEPDVDLATWLTTTPVQRTVAVPITSWDEYRRRFGGYEGPGRLPYAVSAFFAGGGRQAYVVRIVHAHGDPVADAGGRASGVLGGLTTDGGHPVRLLARDEGRWGDALGATLRFVTRPVALREDTSITSLVVDAREWVPLGSLLRLCRADGSLELRYVEDSRVEPEPAGGGHRRVLTLAGVTVDVPVTAEVVTGRLEVVDRDPSFPRSEQLVDLGLRADHPRWLGRVLVLESDLLWPDPTWVGGAVMVTDVRLAAVPLAGTDPYAGSVPHMVGGLDRWSVVTPDDFFDPRWVPGDEVPGDGVQCLADHDDVGLLLAPDLYDPQPVPDADDVADPPTLCGPDFQVHVGEVATTPPPSLPTLGLEGLRLDPTVPADLDLVVAAQRRLVEYAEQRRDLTVLLDVPLGLPQRRVLDWRNELDSAYAAAYHPWLDVAAPDDHRDTLVRINPSAFAAAIVAERELRLGVQHGPANQLAIGAVRVADEVLPEQHDALHLAGIDVFVTERDGIRLTGARTLSRRPTLRQLSVVRLITVLRLTLEREMGWAVFEPSNPALWAEVRRLVVDLLTRFYAAGAFRGATTQDAFFVRCDETTMTRNDLDNGRLVCLVGVAPAEPIEYIVLEVALTSDGVQVAVPA